MAFQLSPGVNITEIDLTTVVPAVASTDGAIAGVFRWGPVDERTLVDSETTLVARFGRPTALNPETFFTAANFLAYGNREYVVRVANCSANTLGASFAIAGGTNTFLTMSGANSTFNPVTLGLDSTYNVVAASANVTVGASVASVNTTGITLGSATTGNGSVYLQLQADVGSYNALALASDSAQVDDVGEQVVKNKNEYTVKDGTFDSDVYYIAKYPGAIGNGLRVSVCDSNAAFLTTISLSNASANVVGSVTVAIGAESANLVFTLSDEVSPVSVANTRATEIIASINENDYIEVGNTSIGKQYLKVISVSETPTTNDTAAIVTLTFEDPYRLSNDFTANTFDRYWEFYNLVDQSPGTSDYVNAFGNTSAIDEMHVVVVDESGGFTGEPGRVLEVFRALSRATDAKTNDGAANYYKDVINLSSKYLWVANDRSNAPSANAERVASSTNNEAYDFQLVLGKDGSNEADIPVGLLMQGYDKFASAEDIDISLVMQGKPRGGVDPSTGQVGFQLANYIIDNICEVRKDCVAFITPNSATVINNYGSEALSLVDWRNTLRSSSYAVLDSGYKRQYDKYNQIDRWVPLNGDIAGLCVRTDTTNDPWWSPAGFNRGQIKNLSDLAFNPRKAERDIMYKNGINPVARFPGLGTVLFGDKTLLAKPSAFDRINVRRLFIVLEKAIATAAKFSLFEFNDSFTRAQFKNLVVPYLRDVQGRRGITDFLVVCDETNNTGEVIDRNEFIGDIYIKPARSINFIQLNFVAVRTAVAFNEVVGKF